ncbi:NAD(P)H-hydrate epimerase [Dyadobacter jejuensis]|uniref:Bifunctional NAD(P)H-hydrate repair enzyme n=1 Tax=Dyadobacter jejuensis TaxID=1082580 RepID=A0A316AGR8_9BACT|nr:NAD(P)H-hydrate dehydratase [Dyadobacter jejuensis]PWJ56822.1 NAD(P)H-hydrate epimerase [Dyadobacter jejuensis]
MKILDGKQVRQADAYTIAQEPISPLALMERAAHAFVHWYINQFVQTRPVAIFCGQGNNGGDGLAIARILSQRSYSIQVYLVAHTSNPSDDYRANLDRLQGHHRPILLSSEADIPELSDQVIIIDALLGSGLNRPADGLLAVTIDKINHCDNKKVAVDIASGLFMDRLNAPSDAIVKPDYTVSFQFPKLPFLLPHSAAYAGEWHVVDIGLAKDFIAHCDTPYELTDYESAERLKKPRAKYAHKGTFGHALIIAGSYGKVGAAVLAAKACLRAGVGLLTLHIPKCAYEIVQVSVPEAMASIDVKKKINTLLPELQGYTAVGIGPGLGQHTGTLQMLQQLLSLATCPLVIDADALNLLSENKELFGLIPRKSILTPHPKEFERLAGPGRSDLDRLHKGREFAQKHGVIICLKGAHTAVIDDCGRVYFNTTGNPGMATGGTGDVLTGVITALLAQGYSPVAAARLGVYAHGQAGDAAIKKTGMAGLTASDVAEHLRLD